MDNFVPLHCHSHYSLLDGGATPEDYMSRCKEIGVTHMSITDHGTLSGHRAHQRACKDAGITPILGCEIYHSEDPYDRRTKAKRQDGTQVYNHLTVLAKDGVGLRNLSILNKRSWAEGFYYKNRVGRDWLFEQKEGLMVMSGCMSGMIPKAFLNNNPERAYRIAREHRENLGDDFYIEVMATNDPKLNHALLKLADDLKIKPVMSSDCHYARREDLAMEEALLILSTSPKRNFNADMDKAAKMDWIERFNYLYPDRMMTFQEIEVYLRDYQTEKALFVAQGIERDDIFSHTWEIASKVGEYPYHENLDMLPQPKGDAGKMLRDLVFAGIKERGIDTPEYRQRANEELRVIHEKGFESYFLILHDVMQWSREEKIRTGPGRGSGAGSLINYALRLTQVDPIKYNLLFSRFLDSGWADEYKPRFEKVN